MCLQNVYNFVRRPNTYVFIIYGKKGLNTRKRTDGGATLLQVTKHYYYRSEATLRHVNTRWVNLTQVPSYETMRLMIM
jgi:hypothetical protein